MAAALGWPVRNGGQQFLCGGNRLGFGGRRLWRLKQSDGQALSLWQRHRTAFAGGLPPTVFARLDDALARCDFDAASGVLGEWPRNLPEQPNQEVPVS